MKPNRSSSPKPEKEQRSPKYIKKANPMEPPNDISRIPLDRPHKVQETVNSSPLTTEMKVLKRPAPAGGLNPPVIKRKAAPANLFITGNKPSISGGNKKGVAPVEKKESVRERLARQMVSPH